MRLPPQAISLRMPGILSIYLPVLLFLAFFFPNTRIEPLNETMIAGRWIALLGVIGFVSIRWLLSKSIRFSHAKQGHLTGLELMFLLAFSWLGVSAIESVNPPLSFAKWVVFLLFLFFCAGFSNLLKRREDLILTLYPFIIFFVGFIWLTPLSTRYYPQRLQASLGYINGFLVFTNALGQFLAAFGIPALLFILNYPLKRMLRVFLIITLFLAVFLTIYSGSRAGIFTSFFILTVALLRWHGDQCFSFLKLTLLCVWLFTIFIIPRIDEQFFQLVYKYHDESEILSSRVGFWQRTLESFQERPIWGFGFGVQKQHAGLPVGFFTIGFREQGSTYYGLLEEVGLIGALPIFLFFAIIAFQSGLSLFRSADPLELMLSRVIFVGLILAAFENYLLALGNATSILVVLAFFLKERLTGMAQGRILQRNSAGGQAFNESPTGSKENLRT